MPNDTAREIFVTNLHRLMEENHVTQVDIAAAMRITPSTVSDWYLGKKYPRVDTMQRLADYLGVTMSRLTTTNAPFSASTLTEEETLLLKTFRTLNQAGRRKVLSYAHDMTEIPSMTEEAVSESLA